MSSRRMLMITAMSFLLVIAVVLAVMLLTDTGDGMVTIQMPVVETDPAAAHDAPGGVEVITVTPLTVQNVLAELERPESYSRTIVVERFWDGGNDINIFAVAVRDGATVTKTAASGTLPGKTTLVTGQSAYTWYDGDSEAYVRGADIEDGDRFQMLPTYEDVLKLPVSAITEASFITENDAGIIDVRYITGELGYRTECRISIELGLLVSVEIYDGDTLTFRMTAGECSTELPAAELFVLPNGANVLRGIVD